MLLRREIGDNMIIIHTVLVLGYRIVGLYPGGFVIEAGSVGIRLSVE